MTPFIKAGLAVLIFTLVMPKLALAADLSLLDQWLMTIQQKQSAYHRELASVLKSIRDGGWIATWSLVSLSFLYGVFHAAGPGHGKAVISTYLLSNESELKRGILLAFLSALLQGITALSLILVLVHLIGFTRRQATDAVPLLEMVSFGLVTLIGIFLMKRALTSFLKYRRLSREEQQLIAKPHSHTHTHDHSPHHSHAHDEACSDCGHVHAPDPSLLSGKVRLREAIGIIASIGIRPCTGSLLVLIFAESLNLRWAGIFSVLAISLGTAITVSALATLAVYSRKLAGRLVARQDSPALKYASIGVMFSGGLIVTLLGVMLFLSVQGTQHPLI